MVTLFESPVHVRTHFLLYFVQGFLVSVLVSSLLLPLALTPVCRSHHRFCVSIQNVSARTQGDVLNRPAEACWDLRTVFFPRFFFFSVPHHTHRTICLFSPAVPHTARALPHMVPGIAALSAEIVHSRIAALGPWHCGGHEPNLSNLEHEIQLVS